MIPINYIVSFGWAKDNELDEMIRTSHKVNELLTKLFADSGMILVDFKLEFGISNGKIFLGDAGSLFLGGVNLIFLFQTNSIVILTII